MHKKYPQSMILAMTLAICIWNVSADEAATQDSPEQEPPWLLTPTISSDPKLSTSLGAFGAYIHKFDEGSPSSMFGAFGNYSTTDSYVYGAFAKAHLKQDAQRLIAGVVRGQIRNDYDDFLGSGLPLQTTDDLDALFLRYLFRLKGEWYLGPQIVSANYVLTAEDWLSGELIDLVGLTGFDSTGVGVDLEYDSRDNQNSPAEGRLFTVNNTAYRESLGGDVSFDAYSAQYTTYLGHGDHHVAAIRAKGRWTSDAPASGYSMVQVRGYTPGVNIAPHMTMFELDERIHLSSRWGASVYAGAACLYGGKLSCSDSENWYPSLGVGVIFLIKPVEKMVVRADLAVGKSGNHGFYVKFGHPF